MLALSAANQNSSIRSARTPLESGGCGGRHERELRARETLFHEGDDARFFYEVVDGILCNYRSLADGRRQVISFAYPGDLIGLGNSATCQFTSEALCPSCVHRISRDALLQRSNGAGDSVYRLFELASVELANMQEHQLLLGRKSATEKIATFLLALADRHCKGSVQPPRIHLPMTRADIADFLGLTLETVSRTLSKFRVMGVIDLPHATTVVIHDRETLEDLAEGEDGRI